MLTHFKIFGVLRRAFLWIAGDPIRPRSGATAWALVLLLIAPFFGALAFVLVPSAILDRGVPARLLQFSGVLLPDISITQWWPFIVTLAIPLAYITYAALNYVGKRRLLQLSVRYQRALAQRVASYYRDGVAGAGNGVPIDAAIARKMMLGDSRYLGRAYLSLISAIPSFVHAVVGLGILVFFIPWVVAILLAVMIVFLPLQGFVASQGQKHSSGFLANAAIYARFLAGSLGTLSALPSPGKIDASAFAGLVTGKAGQSYFQDFENRYRVGYLGDLASNLSVSIMLLILVLALGFLPDIVSQLNPERLILIVVAARYFFSGTSATIRSIVSLGNTSPYYNSYMVLIPRVGRPKKQKPVSFSKSESTQETKSHEAIRCIAGATIGLVDGTGGERASTIEALNVRFDSTQSSKTIPIGRIARINGNLDRAALRDVGAVDFDGVVAKFPRLGELCKYGQDARVQALAGPRGRTSNLSTREAMLIQLLLALDSSAPAVLIGQQQWRLFRQSERTRLINAFHVQRTVVAIINDDGERFVLPAPHKFVVAENLGQAAILREATQSEAEEIAFGLDVSRMAIPSGTYASMVVENPHLSWRHVQRALSAESLSVQFAAPVPEKVFLPDYLVDFPHLNRTYPQLKQWWGFLANPVAVSSGREALPERAVLQALAFALSRGPSALVVPEELWRRITESARTLLIQSLRETVGTVLVWNCSGKPLPSPQPDSVYQVRADGTYRVLSVAAGGKPSSVSARRPRHSIDLRWEGRHFPLHRTVGVMANQSSLSWHQIRHLIAVTGGQKSIFSRPASLIAPAMLTSPESLLFIRADIERLDIVSLQAMYPEIAGDWWTILPLLNALRRNEPMGQLLMEASPSDRFWLATALAMNHDADLIFVRERDLRSISQIVRSRFVASLRDQVLVIWKDNPQPFILPAPDHVVLANSSGIASVVTGKLPLEGLDPETRHKVFAEAFAAPAPDSSLVMTDEEIDA